MKLHIYVTDAQKALKGDFNWSLNITPLDDMEGGGWFCIGSVEFDIKLDRERMTKEVMKELNEEEQKLLAETEVKRNLIEQARQELLAITYQPDEAA